MKPGGPRRLSEGFWGNRQRGGRPSAHGGLRGASMDTRTPNPPRINPVRGEVPRTGTSPTVPVPLARIAPDSKIPDRLTRQSNDVVSRQVRLLLSRSSDRRHKRPCWIPATPGAGGRILRVLVARSHLRTLAWRAWRVSSSTPPQPRHSSEAWPRPRRRLLMAILHRARPCSDPP